MRKEILVYLFLGFLESGKTTLIKNSLCDPQFNDRGKNLLILCEEGMEEIDAEFLKTTNSVVEIIENQEDLTEDFLAECQKKHKPDRVMLEYNGMWSPTHFMEMALPKGWIPVQCITTVNAETVDMYLNNMRSQMMEQFQYCDMVLFNRCSLGTKRAPLRRLIKATNRSAAIAYESPDPAFYEMTEEDLPFDIHADVIEIEDDDFGIWYIDARDNPKNYDGKTVRFKALAKRVRQLGNDAFLPGRHVMTCCEDDIAFLGFVCKSPMVPTIKHDTWMVVTARVTYENHPAYQGEYGPVLHAISLSVSEKPEHEVTTFD